MKLKNVTIIGADDSVTPKDLIDMSAQYPFVEWGILLSRSKQGSKRFPSRAWIQKLCSLAQDSHTRPGISWQLCGAWLEDLCMGKISCPHLKTDAYDRLALIFNAHNYKFSFGLFLERLSEMKEKGHHIIFQMDGVNDILVHLAKRAGIKAQALFDLSHGTGKTPNGWPSPLPGIKCGYAGGIGPDNIQQELQKIAAVTACTSTWIAIETKVRSHNGQSLDLKKVAQCLSAAEPYITHTAKT
jgi:hypothetical protein